MRIEIMANEGASGDDLQPVSPDMIERAGDQLLADPSSFQRFRNHGVRERDLAALAPVRGDRDVAIHVQLETRLPFIVVNFTHETLS